MPRAISTDRPPSTKVAKTPTKGTAMFTYILLALLLAVAALLALASSKPDAFTIARSAPIPAAPSEVFALLQDFHQWHRFSPWEAMDPNMQRSFSGAEAGTGAAYAWTGNKKVGRGTMLVTATTPAESISIDLNFEAPMKAQNTTLFTLTATPKGTDLHWSMSGKNNFTGKIFATLFNIDKMVGKDFERGLANLQTIFKR